MSKNRLDKALVEQGLVDTRTKAQGLIMAGSVYVDERIVDKPGYNVQEGAKLTLKDKMRYVSRGGLKIESANAVFGVDFTDKVVLDVGSSTGGFTDFALQHGATKVYAVDVGTGQLDWKIRQDERVVVREKTDIRDVVRSDFAEDIDIVVIDASFISLRQILPHVADLVSGHTQILAMVKPQFETDKKTADLNKGVIKNKTIRRDILKEFELWTKNLFVIENKADSEVHGAKGNVERFYLLKKKA